jgi:hypothetical protein
MTKEHVIPASFRLNKEQTPLAAVLVLRKMGSDNKGLVRHIKAAQFNIKGMYCFLRISCNHSYASVAEAMARAGIFRCSTSCTFEVDVLASCRLFLLVFVVTFVVAVVQMPNLTPLCDCAIRLQRVVIQIILFFICVSTEINSDPQSQQEPCSPVRYWYTPTLQINVALCAEGLRRSRSGRLSELISTGVLSSEIYTQCTAALLCKLAPKYTHECMLHLVAETNVEKCRRTFSGQRYRHPIDHPLMGHWLIACCRRTGLVGYGRTHICGSLRDGRQSP